MTSRRGGLSLRAAQLRNGVRRTVSRPTWMLENVRLASNRRRAARREFSLDWYAEHLVSDGEAAAAVLEIPERVYLTAVAELWKPESDPDAPQARWDGRDELLDLVGAAVSITKPQVVVETGVASGVTTAVALAAMQRNGRGHLYSVDLPSLRVDEQDFVGRAVPEELKRRWTLVTGPSRRVLPALVERVAPLDIFVHDADHTYESQLAEYTTAWPMLRDGGVLISDDVANPAFVDFAARVGARPHLVPGRSERHRDSAVGLMRKRARSESAPGRRSRVGLR
jgi:predicted O-methyltransferase YrrM